MKQAIIVLMIVVTTSHAFAGDCKKQAKQAVEARVQNSPITGKLTAFSCDRLIDETVSCGVSDSLGGGEAMDIYTVILDKTCDQVIKVELTDGE